MRAKTLLMTAASWSTIAATAMLIMPGRALAIDECGTVNTAADPQVASCAGAFNPYASGITYNETTITPADQGNIKIVLVGTAKVVTNNTGVSVVGAQNFNAEAQVLTAASVAAGSTGIFVQTNLGNATITNSGTISAKEIGLESFSGGGLASATNNAGGIITVSGADQAYGILAFGGSASIVNAGTVTVTGTGSEKAVGLTPYTQTAGSLGTAVNSGTVTVTAAGGNAVGMGVDFDGAEGGATSLTNTGILTVTGGTGAAYGFQILGGDTATILDAQQGTGVATTTIAGDGDLTAANVSVSGDASITFAGVPIALNATNGFAWGVNSEAGGSTSVNVSSTDIGTGVFGADMSISGVNGAIGVGLFSGGPASVVFDRASLSVNGGNGDGVGVQIFSGDVGLPPVFLKSALILDVPFGNNVSFTGGDVSVLAANDATGVSILGLGPNSVSFTNAALTVSGNEGSAVGVTIDAEELPTFAKGGIQALLIGSGNDVSFTVADVSVTGGTSATGVSITSGGPNSVSFTDSNLTVVSGTGEATGILVTGDGDATVTMTPSERASNLKVSGAGPQSTGASLQGDGALAASFGGTIDVTASLGSATGVILSDGESQTVTLDQALNVTAGSGSAGGVELFGASSEGPSFTQMTVHANGPITVHNDTGTGETSGIRAEDGFNLLIDGAPSIVVSGADYTVGVEAYQSMSGAIDATLGSITASSTATNASAVGVYLSTDDAISVSDTGIIDVTGGGGNYGVYVYSSGTSGAINLTLNTVRLHGLESAHGGIGVYASNQSENFDETNIAVQQIETTGDDLPGVELFTNTGAASVTVGALNAGVHSGGISTTGEDSAGVYAQTGEGSLTITNYGLISTLGSDSDGIRARSDGDANISNWRVTTVGDDSTAISIDTFGGSGTITNNFAITNGDSSRGIDLETHGSTAFVNSGSVSTIGADSEGVFVATNGGSATVLSLLATTTGADSDAIHVDTLFHDDEDEGDGPTLLGLKALFVPVVLANGDILITSTNASATGSGSDAIYAITDNHQVTVNLADGGATSSTLGNGVAITTDGAAVINVGDTATTASVFGGLWGLNSEAGLGTTVVNHGSITGGGGAAILLSGGSDVVTNAGLINGFVNIAATTSSFTNGGTWNLFGTSTFNSVGANTLSNSGTMNVTPNATTATTTSVTAPGTALAVTNTGTISLQQGAGGTPHTGDVLAFSKATYTGSGGAKLLVDANLGNIAHGISPLQTADKMVITSGTVAGATTVVVRDLGAGIPGQFNLVGIPVVQSVSSTPNAFVLQGDVIHKGYVDYTLTQKGGNYLLVGMPSQTAFEIVRTGAQAQEFWRRTADAWADQMRSPHFDGSHGLSIWGQGIFADSTSKSRPTYTVAAVNTFTFTPDLDIKNRFDGGLVGIDYSFGNLAVGVLGGYGKQTGRFKIDANHLNVKGYSVGGYARWQLNGFFVDGLLKYDDYKIRQISNTPAFRIPFDGSTFGGELQVGYHAMVGSAFIEPIVSLSSTRSSIDSFDSAAAGASVDFNHARSLYGNAGVRAGTTIPSGNWTITPFVGGYAQGDLHRRNRVDIAAGPTSLSFQDEHGDANARFEAGIVGRANAGFELSANINGVTGGNTRDIAGRVGLAYHW